VGDGDKSVACVRRPCIVVAEYRRPECCSDFAIRKGVNWAGEKCIKNDRKLQALRRVENVGQRLTLSKCGSPSTVGNLQRGWGLESGSEISRSPKLGGVDSENF
jgi:hypothetical protein